MGSPGLTCFLINYFFRAAASSIDQENHGSISGCGLLFESAWVCNVYAPHASRRTIPSIHFKVTAGIDIKEGAKILYKARLLDVFVLGFWLIVGRHISFFQAADDL